LPLALGAWTRPDLAADFCGKSVAWSRDLGGLPVDPAVTTALEQMRPVLAELGCEVVEAEPDLAAADEVFHVLRALGFVRRHADDVRTHPNAVKETVVWNVEEGLALNPERIARAQSMRSELFRHTATFLECYDALALPASLVPPFPAKQEWVAEIAGVRNETYLDWMRACTRISVTAHPAISIPFAFTADGLPVGLQLVGRYGDERGLLELAAGIEAAAGASRRRPQLAANEVAA
jgi:amidase